MAMNKETLHPKISLDQYLALRESSFKIDSKEFQFMPWEWDAINALDAAANETGINAWLATGLIYRPFWNGKFGPHQLGMDKDVQVASHEDRKPLLASLQKIRPDLRWTVENRVAYTETDYGIKTKTLEQSLSIFPLRFREGAIRSTNDKLEILITPGALEDLQNGIVRIDEEFLSYVPDGYKEKVIAKALVRAHKTLKEYPALRLEGVIAKRYEEKYGHHVPFGNIIDDWQEMRDEDVIDRDRGRPHWNGLSNTEREIAEKEFLPSFQSAAKSASPPPRPRPARLPDVLENIRRKRDEERDNEQEVNLLPAGFASWLHFTTRHSPDGEFKEWLVNQRRSRRPIGGKDPYLEQILSYRLFDSYLHGNKKPQQKLTHQGWELSMHLLETSYQLDTDHVIGLVDETKQDSLRMVMRMGMLFHDVGKIVNVYTPGAHEGIGAKMWMKTKPDWVNEEEASLTAWMIKTHDLIGRLEQGLTEKVDYKIGDENFDVAANPSYRGALDPSAIRHELLNSGYGLPTSLAIHKEIWKADVGAVASLRWLLPAADILGRIVLAK